MKWIRPDAFGCEANGFQELLVDDFSPRIHEVGLTSVHLINCKEGKQLPAKIVRIRSLEPLLRAGRIKLRRSPGTSLLLEQMMAFPVHAHDDGPDALEMAIQLCDGLLYGVGNEPQEELLFA